MRDAVCYRAAATTLLSSCQLGAHFQEEWRATSDELVCKLPYGEVEPCTVYKMMNPSCGTGPFHEGGPCFSLDQDETKGLVPAAQTGTMFRRDKTGASCVVTERDLAMMKMYDAYLQLPSTGVVTRDMTIKQIYHHLPLSVKTLAEGGRQQDVCEQFLHYFPEFMRRMVRVKVWRRKFGWKDTLEPGDQKVESGTRHEYRFNKASGQKEVRESKTSNWIQYPDNEEVWPGDEEFHTVYYSEESGTWNHAPTEWEHGSKASPMPHEDSTMLERMEYMHDYYLCRFGTPQKGIETVERTIGPTLELTGIIMFISGESGVSGHYYTYLLCDKGWAICDDTSVQLLSDSSLSDSSFPLDSEASVYMGLYKKNYLNIGPVRFQDLRPLANLGISCFVNAALQICMCLSYWELRVPQRVQVAGECRDVTDQCYREWIDAMHSRLTQQPLANAIVLLAVGGGILELEAVQELITKREEEKRKEEQPFAPRQLEYLKRTTGRPFMKSIDYVILVDPGVGSEYASRVALHFREKLLKELSKTVRVVYHTSYADAVQCLQREKYTVGVVGAINNGEQGLDCEEPAQMQKWNFLDFFAEIHTGSAKVVEDEKNRKVYGAHPVHIVKTWGPGGGKFFTNAQVKDFHFQKQKDMLTVMQARERHMAAK